MIKSMFVLFVISCPLSFSQQTKNNFLSGSLKNDSYYVLSQLADSNKSYDINVSLKRKTPIVAGLLSFAIPGTGEFYTENYLKAGIFAAIEVGALIMAVTYNSKGDDQTEFFENYANEHWDASRYAKWTFDYADDIIRNYNKTHHDLRDFLNKDDYANLFFDANRTQVNWSVLNELESDIGWYYSHKLAPFDDQQYYEMIGKYSQFNVGWDDFDENTFYDYNNDPLVEQFHFYSKERGKANDFYNISKWAVIAVVSNHFISAFDAAWSASKYNKKIKFEVSIEEKTIGFYKEYYPQLNFSYNF